MIDDEREASDLSWLPKVAVGLLIAGGLVYGGIRFVEQSRIADRTRDFVASCEPVFAALLEGLPTDEAWHDKSTENWQTVIDANADLIGTGGEDVHRLAVAMRDALDDYYSDMSGFVERSDAVIGS